MNIDNSRLRDIQQLKHAYGTQILASDSKEERKMYYEKIDELTEEEKQILKRMDVII